jgi:hypothetical protein
MAAAEFNFIEGGAHFTSERMTDVLYLRDPARRVPIFFERKNRKQQVNVALDIPDAIRTPRPQLRANVIDDRNTSSMKPARESQIEFGPINQDRRGRFSFFCGALQITERAPELRQGATDFQQAHNR